MMDACNIEEYKSKMFLTVDELGNLLRISRFCPMAMHVAFPYIDILRYGGEIPNQEKGTAVFACPDVDTLNLDYPRHSRESG